MGLDEVTQICPVPLPSWLSDSGGKGIQVVAVVHGEAQLAERWGEHGRQVVLDTSSVKVFLPGITDVTTLQAASTLCGQASWKVRGQDHATRHDVATPDMIRQLPAGFALVIRGGCAPVIARLPRAWRNPAYRRARRLHAGAPRELPPAPRWSEPVIPRHVPSGTFPLELTMTSNDPIAAILDQLAAHHEQLTRLSRTLDEHAAALDRAHRHHPRRRRPRRATTPTRRRSGGSSRPRRRAEPIARLRAWVEQVYRPGYGHLAATLGPCWEAHDLCLYGAGHRGQLWSVLYLQPAADPGPAVRPGRIPGPHPARPGRPAPGRNPALRSPPRPGTGQHPPWSRP